ncbi:amine oxidase catalytic domain-containing protein [Mytilinidion resinicola]|uniref:Amine oxidase n=1 Tax=Mytilinidion resinicola TaxID=574789 RepID=A0A6A6YS83_9PEZI|nr:amine oxidase catalytic domain-containing protein [Mytilinidion resinicola]KAF2810825.1 amine oxidase catalytic domain-containing protein [Mytilinidion resinicola]
MAPTKHSLDPITPTKITQTVEILRAKYLDQKVRFKLVDIYDCPKADIIPYLETERLGNPHFLYKTRVNVTAGDRMDFDDWSEIEHDCNTHPDVLKEIELLKLPKGARIVNDPWAYGTDDSAGRRRLLQCYMYIVLNDDPESNHYSLPAPFSSVFDAITKEPLWIDHRLGDGNEVETTTPWDPVNAVECSANLLKDPFQTDLKPLQVQQPQGPSFEVGGRNVVWQKWSFRPRRRRAGDDVELGCDCLGATKYFDGYRTTADGDVVAMPNVVCMHETGTTSVVRNSQLIVQCTATLANYEYNFAFMLDQAAAIHFELRATGIVSTMSIRKGVKVPWGTNVAPGVMAAKYQHLFNIRVDPAIDGHANTVAYESHVPAGSEDEDPFRCAFKIAETTVTKAGGYALDVDKTRYDDMKPNTFNAKRALFASKPIWVTRYQDDELFAAGEFTNQSKADTGLGVWATRDDDVKDTDVVLWHSFGWNHVPRPEGSPKPSSFFTQNPSNDVPRSSQAINKSTLVEASCHKL